MEQTLFVVLSRFPVRESAELTNYLGKIKAEKSSLRRQVRPFTLLHSTQSLVSVFDNTHCDLKGLR